MVYNSGRLKIPWLNRLNSGGVMTFRGDFPGQAVHWKLTGRRRATGEQVDPLGQLLHDRTKTDRAGLTVNVYLAPKSLPAGVGVDDYYDVLQVSCTMAG